MTPLFVIDSDDRKALTPMGVLPPMPSGTDVRPISYVRAAIELQPAWVRGDYFFKSLE
jgi:hypothetical protein